MKRNKDFNTFSSLPNTNYRRLWFSTLFGVGGAWIQQITLIWLAWELSGSATMVGILAGLRSIPFFFMAPISGHVIDRMDRRRILMVNQIVVAAVANADISKNSSNTFMGFKPIDVA